MYQFLLSLVTKPQSLAALVGATIVTLIAMVILRQQKKPRESAAVVSDIWIYPIKSCRGIQLSESKIVSRGFLYDRMFVVINGNNRFITQRNFSQLAMVEPSVSFETETMTLSAPGMNSIKISLREDAPYCSNVPIDVTVWSDHCDAVDVGADVAKWFQKYLSEDNVRLVRMTHGFKRPCETQFAPKGQVGFADGFPFLLASENSVAKLNKHLTNAISVRNFRANIIVEGSAAFAEDTWKTIEIGGTRMSVCKPCSRCKVPNINQTTGIMDPELAVTKALQLFRTGGDLKLRSEWKSDVFFGQNLDHEGRSGGVIKVGDKIRIFD